MFTDVGSVANVKPNFFTKINSPAAETSECDDIICSTRVVPDLGIPRINIGECLLGHSFITNLFFNNLGCDFLRLEKSLSSCSSE